jgi:hypothetical protein
LDKVPVLRICWQNAVSELRFFRAEFELQIWRDR